MESKFVQTRDIRLHYLEWSGDGPPVVLLHGTGLCGQVWAPIAERLAPRFRVLALDLRGHGDSEKPDRKYEYLQLGGDLSAVMDALELHNVLLVAHSRGGSAAVIGGAQRVERVSGMVLIEPSIPYFPANPGPTANTNRTNFMAERARRRRGVWKSREQLFRAYHLRDTFKNWREDVLWAYIEGGTQIREDGKVELKCPPEIEAQFYEIGQPEEIRELIMRINVPVLLMTRASQDGRGLASPGIQALREAVPSFQHVTVPNTGHFLPQEQPDVVVKAILEFADGGRGS